MTDRNRKIRVHVYLGESYLICFQTYAFKMMAGCQDRNVYGQANKVYKGVSSGKRFGGKCCEPLKVLGC